MSYQAQIFVCDLRGVSRGEKAVLHILARYHDHRTGRCRISHAQIAADAEMTERHVWTLLERLAQRNVIQRQRDHQGRGAVTNFCFVGMAKKDELASSFREQKDEIHTKKDELASSPNKEKKEKQEIQTLPNPPLQGGNSNYKLRTRDHARLSRWLENARKPDPGGFSGLPSDLTWLQLIHLACADLGLPVEDAKHDFLLMVPDIWEARFEMKKGPESVSA
jgi:predicted transcriptional regulator